MENKTELLKTLIDELVGDVEFQDDKIIINIKKDANKVKINQLSDETFTSICEELGHDKVKELSDNEDYAKFIELAKDWIDNKIDELLDVISEFTNIIN